MNLEVCKTNYQNCKLLNIDLDINNRELVNNLQDFKSLFDSATKEKHKAFKAAKFWKFLCYVLAGALTISIIK